MTSAAGQDGGLLGAIDHQARAHPWVLDALFALVVAALLGTLTASSLWSSSWSA
jgi:hypothetical protein